MNSLKGNTRPHKYRNQIPTSMNIGLSNSASLIRDYIKGNPKSKPSSTLAIQQIDTRVLEHHDQTNITWLGHSAVLLRIGGKNVLIDPMLSNKVLPFPFIGGKRFSGKPPIEISAIPEMDVILITHNHYDHLNRESIIQLKEKTHQFIVPEGVASYLVNWGVEHHKIQEMSWGEECGMASLKIACTPARHFSGRNICDRDRSLWCSYVIASEHAKVFFSGDSGYAPHFTDIGNQYGPFDVTLMECGQYDRRWSAIHMMPEETVQAHMDLRGKLLIPIHWGAFTLSLHDWNEPVERAVVAAQEKQVQIATPMMGETVIIGADTYPTATWWK